MKVNMVDATANMNMDKENDEDLNLSREERNYVPRDRGQPFLHTSTGTTGVQNPEQGRTPPIGDLNMSPPNTHPDGVAGAGAAALGVPVDAGTLTGDHAGQTYTQTFEGGGQGLLFPRKQGLAHPSPTWQGTGGSEFGFRAESHPGVSRHSVSEVSKVPPGIPHQVH